MRVLTSCCLVAIACVYSSPVMAGDAYIQNRSTLTQLASTVPGNGDVNPYGVAIVPVTTGSLVKGEILISNFNNSSNLQGTGSTIVQISRSGHFSVFATINPATLPGACPGGVGLTTALVALSSGFVVVGSLPTTDGTAATAQAGCLIVLDSKGNVVATLSGNGINGPWDMTAVDLGSAAVLFVSNVLNDTVAANGGVVNEGSVLRIVLQTPSGGTPTEASRKVIASKFPERTDPAALVIGPTGLAMGLDGNLYVADTLNNRIASIGSPLTRQSDAGQGNTVSTGGALNGPLGLAVVPNGDILAVNAGDGNIVELTPQGQQLAFENIDLSNQGGGTLFGLAIELGVPGLQGVFYVDDGNNTLDVLN